MLNVQIKKRTALVKAIESEIACLSGQLDHHTKNLEQLNLEISRQKEAYAKAILLSHKLRESNSRILYILASKDLNQAWKRAKFLQQIASNRKELFAQLTESRDKLIETRLDITPF